MGKALGHMLCALLPAFSLLTEAQGNLQDRFQKNTTNTLNLLFGQSGRRIQDRNSHQEGNKFS